MVASSRNEEKKSENTSIETAEIDAPQEQVEPALSKNKEGSPNHPGLPSYFGAFSVRKRLLAHLVPPSPVFLLAVGPYHV